jgi:hypothetical protein
LVAVETETNLLQSEPLLFTVVTRVFMTEVQSSLPFDCKTGDDEYVGDDSVPIKTETSFEVIDEDDQDFSLPSSAPHQGVLSEDLLTMVIRSPSPLACVSRSESPASDVAERESILPHGPEGCEVDADERQVGSCEDPPASSSRDPRTSASTDLGSSSRGDRPEFQLFSDPECQIVSTTSSQNLMAVFSRSDVATLEAEFASNSNPSSLHVAQLALRLGQTDARVKAWFEEKRQPVPFATDVPATVAASKPNAEPRIVVAVNGEQTKPRRRRKKAVSLEDIGTRERPERNRPSAAYAGIEVVQKSFRT